MNTRVIVLSAAVCLIVIAAFADMVADTFNSYVVMDGVQTLSENAAAGADGTAAVGTPFQIFSSGVAGFRCQDRTYVFPGNVQHGRHGTCGRMEKGSLQ